MAVVGHRKDGQRGQLAIQVHSESIWRSLHESEEDTHEEAREEELCQKQDTERCNLVQEMALMEWVVGQEEAHPGGYTCGVLQLR
jgi:hypothetical protein